MVIDVSYAGRGRTGTGVYVDELVRALRARDDVEVVCVRQRRRLRPGGANRVRSAANLALDTAWTRIGLPRAARRAKADVLHHPLPAHSPKAGCPQVVTVHDVAYERFPGDFDPGWRTVARRAHRAAVKKAAGVVCPSQATADDAVELLGAIRERVTLAPHGPGQDLPAAPAAERRHFLYLGSDEPRKRVAALVEAHAGVGAPLVLGGEAAWRAGGPNVIGEPEPTPERVSELLAGALALVHPAPLEGFGLTLLEAMAAGTPVVAVRSRSSEEVCGGAALLIEEEQLAESLRMLEENHELREQLARTGLARAADFSWDDSAAIHVEAYRRTVA